MGALLGLAVGDAVGAAIEFSSKPRWAVLDDMVGGGPHGLRVGEWTDDTAMALALADSLLHDPALDAADLMRRFTDWHERGTYSCTGTCFDIGIATRQALARFRRTGDPVAGSEADASSGNGALMRLSPVAIRHWRDRAELARVADAQTRTTHGSPATLAASAAFAAMLADAIGGAPLAEVLAGAAVQGGWRDLPRAAIEGSGYVVRSLQAAVWAVSRSTDFRAAVLLAANLGDDADTTAAIAGQLAGAVYGVSGIPAEWLAKLAWRERLDRTAGALFDTGWPETDAVTAENWMTRAWTLRERLAALAAFAPALASSGTDLPDGFYQIVYDYGWVQVLPWSDWQDTERGRALLHDPAAMADARADDLANVLTTCIRADRFCEGAIAEAAGAGLLARVAARAAVLLDATGPLPSPPDNGR